MSLFHPPTKNNNEQYIEELKNGCYGMHICTGLWRNNNLYNKRYYNIANATT